MVFHSTENLEVIEASELTTIDIRDNFLGKEGTKAEFFGETNWYADDEEIVNYIASMGADDKAIIMYIPDNDQKSFMCTRGNVAHMFGVTSDAANAAIEEIIEEIRKDSREHYMSLAELKRLLNAKFA